MDAARLALEAGFDAVDVKACHRYLISELHASHTRENSRYGEPSGRTAPILAEHRCSKNFATGCPASG
ncbi:MAG: hypothetical protein QM757_33685 [Paludibaculum sp.]